MFPVSQLSKFSTNFKFKNRNNLHFIMNIKIGCTGWSYQGWSGTFYPKNLKSSNWLKYYSQIFDITEINSTFYKIPSQEMTRRWNIVTPRHFRFTAKFPSIITHEKKRRETSMGVEQCCGKRRSSRLNCR